MQATNTQPKINIGDRVRYRRADGKRECSGVARAIYPGGQRCFCEETQTHYVQETHIGIQVDQPLPAWWPYIGTDRFAPAISELQPTP